MTASNKIVIVDTNIIVRYLLGDKNEQGKQAVKLFAQIQSGSVRAYILESVLTECVFILAKVYQVPRSKIAESLTGLLLYKGVVSHDKEDLQRSLEIFAANSLPIVDCMLLAKAYSMEAGLITFDKKLERYYEHNKSARRTKNQ